MNVILIGYRCSGKSTIGKILAHRLRLEFIDCDEYIEAKTHLAIREIFEIAGEAYFRNLESEAITELSKRDGKVIATGGGVVTRYKNIRNFKRKGFVVYLAVEPETVFERSLSDPQSPKRRPPLTEKDLLSEIKEQMDHRTPYYVQAADLMVRTGNQNPERIAEVVLKSLRERGFQSFDDADESIA